MLESGISLVAVNLPSMWLFFTSLLPEKLVRSVRSMISLHSQRRSDSTTADVESSDASGSVDKKPNIIQKAYNVEDRDLEAHEMPDSYDQEQEGEKE